MQLRSGKVINNSSFGTYDKNVLKTFNNYTNWLGNYLNKMVCKVYELNCNYDKETTMDKLRIYYEMFYNINEHSRFIMDNWDECYNSQRKNIKKLLELLPLVTYICKYQFERVTIDGIWEAKETWTVEDIKYVHSLLGEMDECDYICSQIQGRIDVM